MADSTVTNLSSLVIPAGEDLLLVVDDPNGTPESKKISLRSLLSSLPSNTSITGELSVTANTVFSGDNHHLSGNTIITGTLTANTNHMKITTPLVVGSNNATAVFGASPTGKFGWDTDYLYFATANNTVKRVALSIF